VIWTLLTLQSSKGNALLRPHPRNVANKETYAKEEAIMRRCVSGSVCCLSLIH